MSCYGFFHAGHKKFGNLIRDCTVAINITTLKQQKEGMGSHV
jgi:hypothetical protein